MVVLSIFLHEKKSVFKEFFISKYILHGCEIRKEFSKHSNTKLPHILNASKIP
jgi:hypothetical protein